MSRLIFPIEFCKTTGGMLHSVAELINSLCSQYEVIVVTPNGSEFSDLLDTSVRIYQVGSEKSWRPSFRNLLVFIKTAYSVRRLIDEFSNKNDFIITNNVASEFLINFMRFRKKNKHIFVSRGGEYNNIISKLISLFSSNIDGLVATSRNQLYLAESRILRTRKCAKSVIGNIVDIPVCEVKSFSCSDETKIGVVGYIDEGKNQAIAIEVLSILKCKGYNVSLELFGEANNSNYLVKLKKLIDSLNVKDNVEFHGYNADKLAIYSNIDILLSVSLREGFGRTLVEGMLAERPVIAMSEAGGPRDIVDGDLNGILIDKISAEEIAEKVEMLIINKSFRDNIIRNGKLRAQSYSSDVISGEWGNFLNTLSGTCAKS